MRTIIPMIDLRIASLPQWYCKRKAHVWELTSHSLYTRSYRCVVCRKNLYR